MRCDHCAHDVPDGVFCTRCGAHQGTTEEFGNAKLREHRYAAHPGEHVAQPSVITTLFPHLGHHKIHEFRWALIAGLAGVLILYVSGLIAAAILVAALLGFGLLVPLIQEAAKAAPAIFLPNRKDFPETVDGLVFGIAAGLGFSLAETLINFATTLQYLGHVAPANWIYPLTTISVL